MCQWQSPGHVVTAPATHLVSLWLIVYLSLTKVSIFSRNFLLVTKLVITRWGIIGHENVMARVCSDWEASRCPLQHYLHGLQTLLNKILSGDGILSSGLSHHSHSPCSVLPLRVSAFFGLQQFQHPIVKSWIHSKTKVNILHVDILCPPRMFVR